jgi:hypothetical protein
MIHSSPWRTGMTLALTVLAGYTVCTVLFLLLPGPAMAFVVALFHGLDFRVLPYEASWSTTSFLYAAAVLGAWAFGTGALFSWLQAAFDGGSRRV